ncbi:hypothetical protein CDD83_10412 [Cordyceps sp. RAO-2017]|nr:hypothetical protein CDD83_10412 [Cordyceps sp. RAO-2017]
MYSLTSPVSSARFFSRRLGLAAVSRFGDRRFAYAVAAAAVLAAKFLHVYAHLEALPEYYLTRWGPSFFTQDTVFLLGLRLIMDVRPSITKGWLRAVTKLVVSTLVAFVTLLATISISFFMVAGLELHWRNIGTAGDSSAWRMLLTGLVSFAVVLVGIILIASVLQNLCYLIAGIALDIVRWPVSALLSALPVRISTTSHHPEYRHVPQQDADVAVEHGLKSAEDCPDIDVSEALPMPMPSKMVMVVLYIGVCLGLVAQLATGLLRPSDASLVFMSWTVALLPFVDFSHSSPSLDRILSAPSAEADASAASWQRQNRTALAEPPSFRWLPNETKLAGFEDWYGPDQKHYSAADDPLKISNLDDAVLSGLDGSLDDIKIRHVVLIKLEATRKDVFPIKKGGFIWERLAGSFKHEPMPVEAQERLATLTATANFLTGDYDDGFKHPERPRRGGINFNNGHSTSTYTLKSLVGTLCGLTPLIADFNLEVNHHVYQPCLPHVFGALNQLRHSGDGSSSDDFTTFQWKPTFLQSVTSSFDKQTGLMGKLGFLADDFITKESLRIGSPKFDRVTVPDINYFGMPETTLENHIRDAFSSAQQNKERVFLTHLTSTTHHAFGLPEGEKYVPLNDEKDLDDLSHYVNAVGFVDRWLGRVLDILDAEGVVNETLVVVVGDHGLSIAEQGSVSTYANGNIGNFHVPFVISHPGMPPIDVNDTVNSIQVLPTILDLLAETGSLSAAGTEAARDLARNYEGQSLIRPQRNSSGPKARQVGNWQFTLINPGGSMISVRDARRPTWRLVVPIVENTEWRFTDTKSNPQEAIALVSFDFKSFLRSIQDRHSTKASSWAEEAAFVTRWLVEENARRWHYKQNSVTNT